MRAWVSCAGMASGPLDAALGARHGSGRQQGVGGHQHRHDMGMRRGGRPQHCADVRRKVKQLRGAHQVSAAGQGPPSLVPMTPWCSCVMRALETGGWLRMLSLCGAFVCMGIVIRFLLAGAGHCVLGEGKVLLRTDALAFPE